MPGGAGGRGLGTPYPQGVRVHAGYQTRLVRNGFRAATVRALGAALSPLLVLQVRQQTIKL